MQALVLKQIYPTAKVNNENLYFKNINLNILSPKTEKLNKI